MSKLFNQSVRIEIDRGDAPFKVDVDVLSYYRGTGAPDDPTEVETDSVGVDDFGNEYELTDSEIEDAESTYLTNLGRGDYDPE